MSKKMMSKYKIMFLETASGVNRSDKMLHNVKPAIAIYRSIFFGNKSSVDLTFALRRSSVLLCLHQRVYLSI